MRYAVTMDVSVPDTMDVQVWADKVTREREYCHELQRSGEWAHIWRCVGQYANLSIFDVRDHDRMHEILRGLPLFDHMDITVTAPATHPSDLALVDGDDA